MSKFKFLICLSIAMLFMLPNCSALIPKSEITLAGLFIKDNMAKVKRMYGEPRETLVGDTLSGGGRLCTHYYGNGSLIITTVEYNTEKKKL